MKVRIRVTPTESDLDGIRLDNLVPGSVRNVSPSIGSWLIAQGYAVLEMREQRERFVVGPRSALSIAADHRSKPGRRRTDH